MTWLTHHPVAQTIGAKICEPPRNFSQRSSVLLGRSEAIHLEVSPKADRIVAFKFSVIVEARGGRRGSDGGTVVDTGLILLHH